MFIQYDEGMHPKLVRELAGEHGLPQTVVREIAAAVAEHCALIAIRHEAHGELAMIDLGLVEAVGAQIGETILQEFPPMPAPEPQDRKRIGIGGPGPRAARR
jgi:hypothetical protein